MKKVFAMLLALCLLCVSASALAEVAAEEKALELDGFSLILDAGEYYQVYEKTANQPYVAVIPYYADGDTSTNYNVVWMGGVYEMTAQDVLDNAASIEENIRAEFQNYGVSVDSFTMYDPYETTINDVPCIVVEYEIAISAAGTSMTVYEREIAVGSVGYIFTLSAGSTDDIEKLTQTLVDALVF